MRNPLKVSEDGRRHWRWWTQTINDNDKPGARHGSLWKEGRWIVYSRARARGDVLRFEWHHGWRLSSLDLLVRVKPHNVQLHVGLLGLASWWLTIYHRPSKLLARTMVEERVFGIRVGYIGYIAWVFFAYDEESDSTGMLSYYRSKKARGEELFFGGNRVQLTQGIRLKIRLRLRDRLLGAKVYEKEELRRADVAIPLDGREYDGVWTLTRETWKRPRWPFLSHERVGSWVEVEHPPAHSGKGENSWDCGDDGIFGAGSSEKTPMLAVGDYVKAVLRNRERYGQPSDRDAFQPKSV
jgi:hypothetical protein